MKSLIISFCISFTFLCVCMEIIYYVKVHDRLNKIAKRRKHRDLLCEDLERLSKPVDFPSGKGRESLGEPEPKRETL